MRCAGGCGNTARTNSILCGPCEDKRTEKSRIEELLQQVPEGPVQEILRVLADRVGVI